MRSYIKIEEFEKVQKTSNRRLVYLVFAITIALSGWGLAIALLIGLK
jgi:hypothetical protein